MPDSRNIEGREPVTRNVHDRPWVANLETDAHAENRQLLIAEALDAVDQTTSGNRLDIVTHERHGHPADYLYSELGSSAAAVEITDDGRCDCGGYVTRVTVR